LAINPGAVIGLREPVLNQIKDYYFDIIMLGFQFLFIEDLTDHSVTLTGISPTLDIPSSSHVTVHTDAERNALRVVVQDAGLKVHLNWKDSSSSHTGVADLDGTIDNITLYMSFDATHVNQTYRPKINFDEVLINQNASDFSINYACSECDQDAIDRIEHALGVRMFEHFESKAKDLVNLLISTVVNLQLETMYPETFPLSSDIAIDVGMTGKAEVKHDFVAVPIDSTIFLKSQGYNRPMVAPEFQFVNPDNPGEMILFTSDYVFKTISNILNTYDVDFTLPVYGTNVTITLDGDRIPFHLESEEGHMVLQAGGIVSVPAWVSALEFTLVTKLDLDLQRGDSTAMLYMHPTLIDADFSSLVLIVLGFRIDLTNSIVPFVNRMMEILLNIVFLPRFKIPKLEALPLKFNEAQLEFFKNHTELGVTFKYN
jgi:hypothetical protein